MSVYLVFRGALNYSYPTPNMAQLELSRLVSETLALNQLHGGLLDSATRTLLERMERVLGRPMDEAKTLQLLNIVRGLREKLERKIEAQTREHAAEVERSLARSTLSVSGSFIQVPEERVEAVERSAQKTVQSDRISLPPPMGPGEAAFALLCALIGPGAARDACAAVQRGAWQNARESACPEMPEPEFVRRLGEALNSTKL